jgi:hypothetical protein
MPDNVVVDPNNPITVFQSWLGTNQVLDQTATLKSLWAKFNKEAGGGALDFNTDTGTVAAWTLGQGIGALDGLLD